MVAYKVLSSTDTNCTIRMCPDDLEEAMRFYVREGWSVKSIVDVPPSRRTLRGEEVRVVLSRESD